MLFKSLFKKVSTVDHFVLTVYKELARFNRPVVQKSTLNDKNKSTSLTIDPNKLTTMS